MICFLLCLLFGAIFKKFQFHASDASLRLMSSETLNRFRSNIEDLLCVFVWFLFLSLAKINYSECHSRRHWLYNENKTLFVLASFILSSTATYFTTWVNCNSLLTLRIFPCSILAFSLSLSVSHNFRWVRIIKSRRMARAHPYFIHKLFYHMELLHVYFT